MGCRVREIAHMSSANLQHHTGLYGRLWVWGYGSKSSPTPPHPHTPTPLHYGFFSTVWHLTFVAVSIIFLAACQAPEAEVVKLDQEYGFQGYRLGRAMYNDVLRQAKERTLEYDVIEYETFGSRFADQQPYVSEENPSVFGAYPVSVYAGVLDGNVYAFLLQVESDEQQQNALQDSLLALYGPPQAMQDTSVYAGDMVVRVQTRSWEADSVGLEYGRGDGYAEILVFDKNLRRERHRIQLRVTASQNSTATRVDDLKEIGQVRFAATASTARWRYRYRGELAKARGGSFGAIDYKFVEPFFEVQGKSLFGVQMAFANLSFVSGSDSLRAIEVRFDNTQGQTVGFMDMLRVMERKIGRHAYSDTLHTQKGAYRRAMWYGDGLTITLEENRFRPEKPERADILVHFELERVEVEPAEPTL